MNIVWFKRDLRIYDHVALVNAAKNGAILPVYVLEPELWKQPDMSYRHYMFLQDCLFELNNELDNIGQKLIIKVGNTVDIFEDLKNRYNVKNIWSHQETWNGWTYKRDKEVKKWCKYNDILWHEPVGNGVIRRLASRDGWSSRWNYQMKKSIVGKPNNLENLKEPSDVLPLYSELGLCKDGITFIQKGGRTEGLKLLNSFLFQRGERYTKEMSSPVTAYKSCSRISAHLAFGTLSIREVFQAYEKRNQEIKSMPRGEKGKWPSAMRSFSGRLRWRCHFIQKLEDEPRIEFENLHPAYNSLREKNFNNEYFEAWKKGMTGYPMVDACMRSLTATGWLNFRMRAMVMSFASYHLWLHWKKTSIHLANLFTDYEPGIHYSQVQMQSGTTGINAIRIYNPIKQGIDNDPTGVFIKQWIPELKDMDISFIHTPWESPEQMNGYPMPIVDEKTARKFAADKLYGLRRNNYIHREAAKKIVDMHASRKSVSPRNARKKIVKNNSQGELPI